MTNKWQKILLGIAILVALVCIGTTAKLYWDRYQLSQVTAELNQQLMEANLELGKAHTEFGNAQMHIADLEADLAQAIKDRNEKITDYLALKAEYDAYKASSSTTIVVVLDSGTLSIQEKKKKHLYQVSTYPSESTKLPGHRMVFLLNLRINVLPLMVTSHLKNMGPFY